MVVQSASGVGLADGKLLFRDSRNNIDLGPEAPYYFARSEIFRFFSPLHRSISEMPKLNASPSQS
jgi:hypothetical protein